MNKKIFGYLLLFLSCQRHMTANQSMADQRLANNLTVVEENVAAATSCSQPTYATTAYAQPYGSACGPSCGPAGNCCPPTVCNTRCYPCNPPCCRGWTPGPRWRFCCRNWGWRRNKACCYPKVRCCQPVCAPAAEVVAPFDDYRYAGPSCNSNYQEITEYSE